MCCQTKCIFLTTVAYVYHKFNWQVLTIRRKRREVDVQKKKKSNANIAESLRFFKMHFLKFSWFMREKFGSVECNWIGLVLIAWMDKSQSILLRIIEATESSYHIKELISWYIISKHIIISLPTKKILLSLYLPCGY